MSEGGKITYTRQDGFRVSAYVEITNGVAVGTDKHSDEPMTAYWSDQRNEWVEMPKTDSQ